MRLNVRIIFVMAMLALCRGLVVFCVVEAGSWDGGFGVDVRDGVLKVHEIMAFGHGSLGVMC